MEREANPSSQGRDEINEARFRSLIEQAPAAMAMTRGEDLIFESINASMLQFINKKTKSDVLGKKLADVLPELTSQPIFAVINRVLQTGETYTGTDVEAQLARDGVLQRRYFDITYSRMIDAAGVPSVLHMALDVTERVIARRTMEESEAKLRSILNSAPTAMGVFVGHDLIVENANQLMIELMAAGPDIEGKSFRQLLSGLVEDDQKFIRLIDDVRATGKPFEAEEVEVYFKAEGKLRYFNVSFLPLRHENGAIYAVLDVSVDVTGQVLARKKLEEKEQSLSLAIEISELGMFDVNLKSATGHCSQQVMDWFGLDRPELPIADVFAKINAEDRTMAIETIERSIAGEWGGRHDFVYRVANPATGGQQYLRSIGQVQYENGLPVSISGIIQEVTKDILANRKLEESEVKFRSLIEEAPVATGLFVGPDLIVEVGNKAMLDIWGKGDAVFGKPLREALPELEGQPFLKILDDIFITGITYEAHAMPCVLERDGALSTYYFDFTYKPLRNPAGEVYAITNMAVDVTEQLLAKQKLEKSEDDFRKTILAAPVGVCMLDARTLVNEVVNKMFIEVAGRPEQAIIGHLYWDAFPEIRPNYERILNGVVETGTPYYADEVELMLIRHGREETVYVTFVFMPLKDTEGKVKKVINYIVELTMQVTARHKVEELVAKRTNQLAEANESLQAVNKELQRSNANLEEFAHAASHDLKEPIRKITFFTQQIKSKLSSQLANSEMASFNRIENATERMGNLIDDLLLYSHVSQRPHQMEAVDLDQNVQQVLEDLELDIQERGAIVDTAKLPMVQGYRRQLQQLFQNLVSNALKYSKADVPPHVEIGAAEVENTGRSYHVISVKDNGIGFDQEYEDKIFQMFARLHGKHEYSGTGVGLSIVKKVVENHHGFINVKSEPGTGSTFEIYLPVQQTE